MPWTPQQLLEDIKSKTERMKDYIVPSRFMRIVMPDVTDPDSRPSPILKVATAVDAGPEKLRPTAGANFLMQPHAHSQLQQWLKIPKAYYQKCLEEAPDLLSDNVNHWLGVHADRGTRRLVRTLKPTEDSKTGIPSIRAILSPRYKIMDNYDLLRYAMPEIKRVEAKPWRAFVTDTRLDILFVSKTMEAEIGTDLPTRHAIKNFGSLKVVAALNLGNSEVGMGGLSVGISAVISACSNLYIGLTEMHKVHLGREITGFGDITDLYGEDTREYMQKTVWLQTRDMIRVTFTQERFEQMVDGFKKNRSVEVEQPVHVLKSIAEREGFDEDGLLSAFMEEPEPTGFGILQAITRAAKEAQGDAQRLAMHKVAGSLADGGEELDDLKSYFTPDSKQHRGKEEEEDEAATAD